MKPFLGFDYVVAAIFFLFAATLLTGSVIAVRSSRIIHSVCGLAIGSVGLAGLYYFLNSPFLALMEILIYIGAVCITVIFAIMLSETDEVGEADLVGSKPNASVSDSPFPLAVEPVEKPSRLLQAGALLVSTLVFAGLSFVGLQNTWGTPTGRVGADSVEEVGKALLTTHSLSFELISVVLLLAIVGSLVLARLGRTHA
ncbi:MAG: NADH-quinone oxidoreductase subunit J [Verrucomicrobiota bacterium]|nr:NADH-quinone oxidoreductase subunit J [Verrucomicrobiota bacterium]